MNNETNGSQDDVMFLMPSFLAVQHRDRRGAPKSDNGRTMVIGGALSLVVDYLAAIRSRNTGRLMQCKLF